MPEDDLYTLALDSALLRPSHHAPGHPSLYDSTIYSKFQTDISGGMVSVRIRRKSLTSEVSALFLLSISLLLR